MRRKEKEFTFFNWKRKLPAFKGAYVPLIVKPLKLTKHTTVVISQVDINITSLPFLVAKHMIDHMKKVAYVHRMHNGQIIGSEETRWRGGASEF